jgi:excisionase family DNA binding protein
VADILTIPQLAKRLRVSARKIYELTRERNRKNQKHPLPLVRIGRCVRFQDHAITAWLATLERESVK